MKIQLSKLITQFTVVLYSPFSQFLKAAPTSDTPSRDRSRSYNTTPNGGGSSSGGGSKGNAAPKTLADFQKLASRNRSNTSPAPPPNNTSNKTSSG